MSLNMVKICMSGANFSKWSLILAALTRVGNWLSWWLGGSQWPCYITNCGMMSRVITGEHCTMYMYLQEWRACEEKQPTGILRQICQKLQEFLHHRRHWFPQSTTSDEGRWNWEWQSWLSAEGFPSGRNAWDLYTLPMEHPFLWSNSWKFKRDFQWCSIDMHPYLISLNIIIYNPFTQSQHFDIGQNYEVSYIAVTIMNIHWLGKEPRRKEGWIWTHLLMDCDSINDIPSCVDKTENKILMH